MLPQIKLKRSLSSMLFASFSHERPANALNGTLDLLPLLHIAKRSDH